MLSHPSVLVIESALASTMEQKNFGVSTNNIPISDRKEYNIQLIKSVNRFVNRVRWKVFFLFNPEAKGKEKNTFGLKSQKKAPKNDFDCLHLPLAQRKRQIIKMMRPLGSTYHLRLLAPQIRPDEEITSFERCV